MRMRTSILVAAVLLAGIDGRLSAAEFPAGNVTIVSPYQAGGTSDIISRILSNQLSRIWGKSVVVENRPGANGGIGVTAVVQAPPDGQTLLAVASSALTINPLVYPKLPYVVERDLAPITRTGSVANVLVVNPSVAARNAAELISLAKEKPGQLTYASQGTGSNGHMTGEMFKQRAGIDMVHVPYKGSAPAVQDLLGGRVQLMFDNLPSVLPLIRSGQLRALAVTTAQRAAQLPDVPTIAESGLAGFDTSAWFALLAPKQTPADVRSLVERAAIAALMDENARNRFADAGIQPTADGAAELKRRIDDETRMWRNVIATAGIKLE
jgi:tripartite-type tricarboxylate transporter receptor subunit TctC